MGKPSMLMQGTIVLRVAILLGFLISGLASLAFANHALSLTQEAIVSGGGPLEAPASLQALTVLGEPLGGGSTSSSLTLDGGYPPILHAPSIGSRAVTVEGAVDEPCTSIVVNGVAATRTGLSFKAEGVRLFEGANDITVTATDLTGHAATRTITVWLDTHPPARPTVVVPPAVTMQSTQTLTGTKTKGTSLWINGVEVVPINDTTTWSVTVSLVEGDNVLSIVTKDTVDQPSTAATILIVLDRLPPVITVTAPAMTNLTPLLLQGTVDDRATTVHVNGLPASRTGKSFQVSIPLTEGPNVLTVTATSPNGYVSTKTLTVNLGTIPTITDLTPTDGSLLEAGTALTITAHAVDKESNPVEFQLWLDGQLLADWHATAFSVWTPTLAQEGLHTIEARVRDGFGGFSAQQTETCVVRVLVSP